MKMSKKELQIICHALAKIKAEYYNSPNTKIYKDIAKLKTKCDIAYLTKKS